MSTIAVMAAMAEKKKFSDRSYNSDHKQTTFQGLQTFPYDRYDRYNR